MLFDWDGTLVDSAATTYACYAEVFERFGIPFDRGAFERTYSPDWYRTYQALELPRAHWDAADALWLEAYTRSHSPLLPGASPALGRLRDAGLRLGLVTSGDRSRVAAEIDRLGVSDAFEVILCRADLPRRKPAPDGLLVALERLRVPATASAYVGDSPEDVEMSRTAGAHAVGIPGGFPNHAALRASRPDHLAESLEAAVTHLLTLC